MPDAPNSGDTSPRDHLSGCRERPLDVGGSKCNKTLRYLKEASGKPILPKDVENLIAEMRRETYASLDDNIHVSELL
ncbi:hypothetical protein PI124_g10129 [Phytophthora idaei]|nr:hypothetical protein PI124_g10129 [Phytophthora idaei]